MITSHQFRLTRLQTFNGAPSAGCWTSQSPPEGYLFVRAIRVRESPPSWTHMLTC